MQEAPAPAAVNTPPARLTLAEPPLADTLPTAVAVAGAGHAALTALALHSAQRTVCHHVVRQDTPTQSMRLECWKPGCRQPENCRIGMVIHHLRHFPAPPSISSPLSHPSSSERSLLPPLSHGAPPWDSSPLQGSPSVQHPPLSTLLSTTCTLTPIPQTGGGGTPSAGEPQTGLLPLVPPV